MKCPFLHAHAISWDALCFSLLTTLVLVQAIFSDDSDGEVENSTSNQADDPQKKIEAANTTLNRLMAGDFLESLGKELGLEVPSDMMPQPLNKARTLAPKKESNNVNPENISSLTVENKPSSIYTSVKGSSIIHEALHDKGYGQESAQDVQSPKNELMLDNPSGSKIKVAGSSENEPGKIKAEKMNHDSRKAKTPTGHRRNWSSDSSSEDERERGRKRSRRHRQRSDSSDTDSSSEHGDPYHSRSKGRKKGSSREKSGSSRRHSKHHKHGSRDSPTRSSHHSLERERSKSKREKRR